MKKTFAATYNVNFQVENNFRKIPVDKSLRYLYLQQSESFIWKKYPLHINYYLLHYRFQYLPARFFLEEMCLYPCLP